MSKASELYQIGVMLIYGKRKSVDKAIKCMQRAIILDDTNYRYWQLLGEAYYQRGSLNPAINCFLKSLERVETQLLNSNDEQKLQLEADRTFSKLRMSDIRLSVSHLDEALSGYSDIISRDVDNVPSLVGLSRTELQMAQDDFSLGQVESGRQHCINALKYALRTTILCPHLVYTWKLASDCCLAQILRGQRSPFQASIEVPGYPGVSEDILVVDRLACIEMARQFLSKALSIDGYKSSTCLWHNLGISLYLRATVVDSVTIEQKRDLLTRALKCLIKALDNDRGNSQVRNSIGVVAYHLNFINTAQNFLIKSIQSNMSTSEIQFANLGYMLLDKKRYRVAKIAFERSQAEEPMYCRPWVGLQLMKNVEV